MSKHKLINPVTNPRYDKVYEEGLAWLNTPGRTGMSKQDALSEPPEQVLHDVCVEVLHALGYSISQGEIGAFCNALDKIKPIVAGKLVSREHIQELQEFMFDVAKNEMDSPTMIRIAEDIRAVLDSKPEAT